MADSEMLIALVFAFAGLKAFAASRGGRAFEIVQHISNVGAVIWAGSAIVNIMFGLPSISLPITPKKE